MSDIDKLKKELRKAADKKKAAFFPNFFKTGKGQYGEGDIFLGVSVPKSRIIALSFLDLPLAGVKKLLASKVHEERFVALEILVAKYEKGKDTDRKKIVEFYVRNLKKVNNWDLVDTSASYILGSWLLYRPRAILFKLAKSNNLWEKRVAIVSTFAFISKGQIEDTFKITKMLMHDPHDLIHKACGWMLREAGKQSQKELEKFLDLHAKYMPRTMLRYAIERFSSQKRLKYRSKH